MTALRLFALTAANSTDKLPDAAFYLQIVPFILLAIVFYFMLIRPQKKREKAEKEMRGSIKVGDEISTIGGIIGRVVNVQDDILVIESSNDRSKLRIYKWAVRGKESMEKCDNKSAD